MSQQPASRPAESPPATAPLAPLLEALQAAQQGATRPLSRADRAAWRRLVLRLLRLPPDQQAALVQRISEQLATLAQEALEDEGIDYSDIPDVGDDDAYWTGGRVGPVLATKGDERTS